MKNIEITRHLEFARWRQIFEFLSQKFAKHSLTREVPQVFKAFKSHLLATSRPQWGMKNPKRICALAPFFPRYRILKVYTKRDQIEKWLFSESSTVFKWKYFKASRIARPIYSGFSARLYLISITSIGCSSGHRRPITLHFTLDWAIK